MNFHRISKVSLPFALLVGVLLVAPALASAATHPFLETFGSAAQPTFGDPEGMAVDQVTGDLLVIDSGNQTLSRFKPDGTPADFSALGTNVIDGFETFQGA
jgi:DNA-binding beta-propeller fold protein YncE